ncbi:hypothetical protein DFP73DRAFT_560964, partial [Morchella snyderi]
MLATMSSQWASWAWNSGLSRPDIFVVVVVWIVRFRLLLLGFCGLGYVVVFIYEFWYVMWTVKEERV